MEAPKLFGQPMVCLDPRKGDTWILDFGALRVFVREVEPDSWGWTGQWGNAATYDVTPAMWFRVLDVNNAVECAESCIRNIALRLNEAIKSDPTPEGEKAL